MTLEYPGNNFSVVLATPKSVKGVPGRFDNGSVPGSVDGRCKGLYQVLPAF